MEIAYTINLLNNLVIFIFIFNINKQSKNGQNKFYPIILNINYLPFILNIGHHIKHKTNGNFIYSDKNRA